MIFTFISRACSDLPVAVCCRVMKVSTSGFYAWLSQPCSDRDHADAVLTNTIVDIHRMSRRSYGSPRVHAELRLGHGTFCSRKRVERLMRQAGAAGIHRRRRGGCTAPTRAGSSTSGWPCSTTAPMIVDQHTPSSRARPATGRALAPTWRPPPTRPDRSTPCGPRCAVRRPSTSWPRSRRRRNATAACATPAGLPARSRPGRGSPRCCGPAPRPAHRIRRSPRRRPPSRCR
jgi:hypothetical protein